MLSIPAPPHSAGMATPMSPSSASCFTASRGNTWSVSQRRAFGLSSFSANSRQRSRTWRCSSVSWMSMASPG